MRPASAALKAYLADPTKREVVQADLYTFQLATGEVLRYSGIDVPITLPSAAFPDGSVNVGDVRTFPLGPPFDRTMRTEKIGSEPTEMEVDVFPRPTDRIGTLLFTEAVHRGLFDGARLELDRFFAPTTSGTFAFDTSLGCVVWFYGRVAKARVGRSRVTLTVRSLLDLLTIQQLPRRLYQASCNLVFGGTACGYDRETGTAADGTAGGPAAVTLTALVGSTQSTIDFGSAVSDDYVEGSAYCETGENAGAFRGIRGTGDGSQVELTRPWLYPVAGGDEFKLLPGCAHTVPACQDRNNLPRYGGMPYIPPPETAV